MNCEHCVGGIVELFYSSQKCDRCDGRGNQTGQQLLDEVLPTMILHPQLSMGPKAGTGLNGWLPEVTAEELRGATSGGKMVLSSTPGPLRGDWHHDLGLTPDLDLQPKCPHDWTRDPTRFQHKCLHCGEARAGRL